MLWVVSRAAKSRRWPPVPGLALAVALAVAACSSSTVATSSPGATSTAPDSPTPPQEETDMTGFVLISPSFADGGAIPSKHTCDGADVSPALSWSGAPAGTAAFALIVDDPDARGFVHWVAFDIAGATTGSLPEGVAAGGPPPQGRTDFGRAGWGGPCPPGGTHHYVFTLYALSGQLALTGGSSAGDVRSAMAGKILAQTGLIGTYKRGG
jgi:Raf kinase inhibitor-like YbhB/YbcL family protein